MPKHPNNIIGDAALNRTLPIQAAQIAFQQYPVKPTPMVRYVSKGNLLILAHSKTLNSILSSLPNVLEYFVLLTDPCPRRLARNLGSRKILFLDRISQIKIKGFLGSFRVDAYYQGKEISANRKLSTLQSGFDLVLDLLDVAVTSQNLPPIGCFVPGASQQKLNETIDQLPQWVGEFDKPKYFHLIPTICAHSASGVRGCTKCIEACATKAILSLGEKIEINPYLCQGCGDCATVCPSGAVRYSYPALSDTLNRLRRMLQAYSAAGGEMPALLFHDSEEGRKWLLHNSPSLPIDVIPFELEALGSAGLEIWLAALAFGAASILLLDPGGLTRQTSDSIKCQLSFIDKILCGIGYVTSPVKRINTIDQVSGSIPAHTSLPTHSHARFDGIDDKRSVIRLAVDHLRQHSTVTPECTKLSPDAPFGEIVVDPDQCTLCMSCVSLCPENALTDGKAQPRLGFIESNCVQCGICKNACPENAITLNARYLYDTPHARQTRILHEDAPFLCIECGKAFATQAMIKTISEKLKTHPMFNGDNKRHLMMCDECRVKFLFPVSADNRSSPTPKKPCP